MQSVDTLKKGCFYHIYNHGVADRDLFRDTNNFDHFLRLYYRYITSVAGTYAWVLMPNHFHVLVKIKEDIVYRYPKKDACKNIENKWETIDISDFHTENVGNNHFKDYKIPKPHMHFSHLFNAYNKYYNKYNKCSGPLFRRPFNRKKIDDENYLRRLVIYIHNNPVHHGFSKHPLDYPWSSYRDYFSEKKTKLKLKKGLTWFGDIENFKYLHDEKVEISSIDTWLGI